MTDVCATTPAGDRPVRRSAEDLRKGLIEACQEGNHWCCQDGFLEICSLSRGQLEAQVKKWWGTPEIWLDMLATEIGKGLGMRVDLSCGLGEEWTQAVDAWVDTAYASATAEMSCPPQRAILFSKTAQFIKTVLDSVDGIDDLPPAVFVPKTSVRINCEACGKTFSKSLGRCSNCFPPALLSSTSKQACPEEKQADWNKLPRLSLTDVPWDETAEVLWCHGGSGGALLLRLNTGIICAKKCSPEDMFAQRLANTLGIRTAQMRVLCPGEREMVAFQEAVAAVGPSVGDDNWVQIRKILKSNTVCVMEFVDGFGMMGAVAGTYLRQAGDSQTVWYDLGRLMAFDMLINNFDRLPLAWTNDGNLGNVLLGSSLGPVVGIDQCVAPITHPAGLHLYLSRVQQAVTEARDGESNAFRAVKDSIFNNSAVELTAGELRRLRSGCADFAAEVVCRVRNGDLEQTLQDISLEVSSAFARSWRSPLEIPVSELMKACCDLTTEVSRTFQKMLE